MPYIPEERRPRFKEPAMRLGMLCENKGDLNYTICMLIWSWVNRKGPPKYNDHDDVIGVLTDVRDEYKRRKMNPYEDLKITENGDIW